jgi:hypothetical protein
LVTGFFSKWAAAGTPAYTVNWAPESVTVPVLSTPFLVALAALLAVIVFRISRHRPAVFRAGVVLLTAVASGALIAGSAELRAGSSAVPECTGELGASPCGDEFGNACGSPIVVTYSDVDPQNCGSLEGGLPAGSVLQDGENATLPSCSLGQCARVIDSINQN